MKRPADGKTLDIGVTRTGGVADAAAQDAFCAGAVCVINRIYDQSGKGNDLLQAPPGPLFPGPAKGAFDTQPIADMAPITIGGRKAYGVYIMPGMGFRNNDARDLAVGDEPEGIYYVVDGTHYDSGCCFDYGNASTNGLAVGTGTMETTYFGTATVWGRGRGPGPWIMADLEAGLFSGYEAKVNEGDPTIDSWRFVTAVVHGGGGNQWELHGGNAQSGALTTFYRGVRPGSKTNAAYFPMHKQGAILLGIGGDNGNGSAGTFYEGVMTAGYPSKAATDAVHANIVAAKYDVPRVTLSRLTSFTPGASRSLTLTFTNTMASPANAVKAALSVPKGWVVSAEGPAVASSVAPGASVTLPFRVTSPAKASAGYVTARVNWKDASSGTALADTATTRVRNAIPVKINEVSLGSAARPSDQFIELYNASETAADLSGWTLIHTASQWAPSRLAVMPQGTMIAPGGFYLLGLAGSGLATAAQAGDSTVYVRSTAGFEAGQRIEIEGETRTIVRTGSAASPLTTVFIPVSSGPWLNVSAGSTVVPVANVAGFESGQKIGIDAGGQFELATVTAVGKAATQTTLREAVAAGATEIRLASAANISAGDLLTIGTGARKEMAKASAVSEANTVRLADPLQKPHAAGVDVSTPGTGIRFTPATRFAHTSGDAVQALGSGIVLDRPLTKGHAHGAPVRGVAASPEGFQATAKPNQWFGSALSGRAGSIALMDPTGAVIVDAIVYGSQQSNSSGNGTIASPEIATLEGDQRQGGCIAVIPGPAGRAGRSLARFPDGRDLDSLCQDFRTQPATTLPLGSTIGASVLKVASVAEFAVGQTIVIDEGEARETAVIATVGSPGATTVSAPLAAGGNVIRVASGIGFSAGQTVTIGTGPSEETAVIATVARNRGGATVTVAEPLKNAYAAGAQISGSGIKLNAPLRKPHVMGTAIARDVPTPGAPNEFASQPR